MIEFYEPNAHLLTVGTKVRVRVSPECEARCPACLMTHHERTGQVGIIQECNDGRFVRCTGCAYVGIEEEFGLAGHRYVVAVDGAPHGCFAAIELQPLQEGVDAEA